MNKTGKQQLWEINQWDIETIFKLYIVYWHTLNVITWKVATYGLALTV